MFKIKCDDISKKFINLINWNDISWGFEKKIIDLDFVEKYIDRRLNDGIDDDIDLSIYLELNSGDEYKVINILKNIYLNLDDVKEKLILSNWLYIILKTLYENKENYDDPLQEVEIIYADFDYPCEIEELVRYMPKNNTHDESTLYKKWQAYIKSFELKNINSEF